MYFQFWCRYCQSAVQRGYTKHDRWECKFLKASHQSVLSNSKRSFMPTLLTLNDAPSCPDDLWTLDLRPSGTNCSHEMGNYVTGETPPGTRLFVSLGSPRHRTPTYPYPPPAAYRGWRICSYDLPAWEKARHFDSQGVFSLGKDCKLAVQEM